MPDMASESLKLIRTGDGYFRTFWLDDGGVRRSKSFGKTKRQAETRFSRFHAEWRRDPLLRNPSAEGPLTINAAWELFAAHAGRYYRRADGAPTGEAENLELATRPMRDLFGDLPAEQFSPKHLKLVRAQFVDDDLCVNVINQRVRKIRHVFKWFAAEMHVPASVWHALQAVEPLKRGRSEARATDPVQPVPDAYVWDACKHLPPTVRAMVELQYYTGMRPGEVCSLRPIDIHVDGDVWIYRPLQHKTRHFGHDRLILFGPRAQKIVKPFLTSNVEACVFSPRRALRERYDTCATHRHQAVTAPESERRVGDRYEPKAYARAITYVCRQHDIPHWSPNRLRHNFATRLRREYGLDVVQLALGHASADITQVYAEADMTKLRAVVARVG